MAKKVFISQPMRDKTEKEILAKRNEAIKFARVYFGKNVQIIDSYLPHAPNKTKPLWFLGNSLQLMSDVDAVIFVKGWEDYRGCRIEHTCAMEYGITICEL